MATVNDTPIERNGKMLLDILNFVLDEQLAGRDVTDPIVAERFKLSLEEVSRIKKRLEDIGEL